MDFKDPKQEIVIARCGDPDCEFCLGIITEYDGSVPDFDLADAMRATARDYATTEEGLADENVGSGDFNWGDFVNSVPDDVCVRHGFRVTGTFVTHIVVDHDELLLAD